MLLVIGAPRHQEVVGPPALVCAHWRYGGKREVTHVSDLRRSREVKLSKTSSLLDAGRVGSPSVSARIERGDHDVYCRVDKRDDDREPHCQGDDGR